MAQEGARSNTRVTHAQVRPLAKLKEVYAYHELWRTLVRKELKVKYKNSALGFAWSMGNPLMQILVFYVVFAVFLKSAIPSFQFFLMSGVLPWSFFSTTLGASTTSITGNADLVKKVYFPREILPLAGMGSALVHFALQSFVLLGLLAVFRYPFIGWNLLLIPAALLVLIVLASALGILLAAINVEARDTQHLLEIVLLAWFWFTPIVYSIRMIFDKMSVRSIGGINLFQIYMLNPMAPVVAAFQRAIYRQGYTMLDGHRSNVLLDVPYSWYLWRLGAVLGGATVLMYFAMRVFSRYEGNFAEEL
ncbi:MAG: ABC transporter permease [Actinomycetota bacterium]